MNSQADSEFDLDTPCKQIAQLQLNNQQPPKAKSAKLLSTKSLTQLIPKNYFFSRRKSAGEKSDKEPKSKLAKDKKLTTSKSYTNGVSDKVVSNNANQVLEPSVVNRIGSASMIVEFPRQSTSNSLAYQTDDSSTLTASNLSPIVGVGSQNEIIRSVVASTPTLKKCPRKVTNSNDGKDSKKNQPENDVEHQKEEESKPSKKFKPFKGTALVLRDVKNSIGLRMKAKHESRAFEKLTDELITPPTKLYSPFNIYNTPGSAVKKANERKEKLKSKRRLNLSKNNKQSPIDKKNDSGNYSMADQNNGGSGGNKRSPKGRISLQHKKHLIQANKFAFDSPTGRLRETVKDVEHFQQCIEDISKAIRERNKPDLI